MKRKCFIFSIILIIWISSFAQSDFTKDDLSLLEAQLKQKVDYLEFKEVDVKDVLRQLAKQYGLNIVFSESVKGNITVQLQGVSLREVLDSVITINGFVYIRKDAVIKVTTPDEAERESKQTKVFRLNNADALQLKATLQKVLSQEGTIEADVRSNSLIITDTPAVIAKVEEMLPSLDEITKQVLIEAKFVETSLGTTEKLGINWTVTAEASGSKRDTTFPFHPDRNDRNDWGRDIFPVPHPDSVGIGEGTVFPSSLGFPYTSAAAFTFGTLDLSKYRMVMDFLKTKTGTNLISSPRIVTLDNKQAEINIGKARPIPQFEINSDTGDYQITGFSEKIEGVTLTVTPQVSKGGGDKHYIRLKLKPKVTTFSETVAFTNPSFEYPILSERFTDTEVILKDGETIVIGGLIENKKTETIRKVPFLGDVPLLGYLFSYKNTDPNSKTELLIFVTASIVKESNASPLAYTSNIISSPRQFKLKLR